MKSWTETIKTILRLYKWRLLALALMLVLLTITRDYVIATKSAEPPPGSIPTPNIDPL